MRGVWAIGILLLTALAVANPPAHRHPRTASPAARLEFPTVAAARKALQSEPGATSTTFEGWTFFDDAARKAQWTFAPDTHAAHPAAIRRAAVEREGHLVIEISLLCEGARDACGHVLKDFEEMKGRRLGALRR
jgi:hypothetical protein